MNINIYLIFQYIQFIIINDYIISFYKFKKINNKGKLNKLANIKFKIN